MSFFSNAKTAEIADVVSTDITKIEVQEGKDYTSKEEVAAYLYQYGELPSNYITKEEAEKLGWQSKVGNLAEVAPGKSIGGEWYKNYEGLPEADGRQYYVCDINYTQGFRGSERLVYSSDGLIYYTPDAYESFELLYSPYEDTQDSVIVETVKESETDITEISVEQGCTYISKEEVAAYLYQYGELPENFITKEEADALGWENGKKNLDEVASGKSLGGSELQYEESALAQKEGRIYYECDINYTGGERGAERLVYSNDGMIYYTPDHYETYELLYRVE